MPRITIKLFLKYTYLLSKSALNSLNIKLKLLNVKIMGIKLKGELNGSKGD